MRADLLRDAIDMHAPTMPDVASRSMTDIALAQRAMSAGHVILSNDLGQAGAVGPVDGLVMFLERLNAMGVGEDDLHRMVAGNPRKLLVSGLGIGSRYVGETGWTLGLKYQDGTSNAYVPVSLLEGNVMSSLVHRSGSVIVRVTSAEWR